MKTLFLIALLCLLPAMVFPHPGKTDRYGGHNCIKDCEEWKLYYKEYHLHDKDGKPIRIARKPGKKRKATELQSAPAGTAAIVIDPPQSVQTVTVHDIVTRVEEVNRLPFHPLLLVVLVLLMLLLILRTRREKEEGRGSKK